MADEDTRNNLTATLGWVIAGLVTLLNVGLLYLTATG
jgi:hypothetical protein